MDWNIMKCEDVMTCLRRLCPEEYAEGWDNVGLLVGDEKQEVKRILLALDATDEAILQAGKSGADMLVTHHPMIFSPIKRVVAADMTGRRILGLSAKGIACYAMHTNFDVCCMADEAAARIGMNGGGPVEITGQRDGMDVGIGKICDMPPQRVEAWAALIKERFGLDYVVVYGDGMKEVSRVAICPGSGKSMIGEAYAKGAELLITGDIGHHEAIDAVEQGLTIIDAGHYGLEHIFIPYMKEYLEKACRDVKIAAFAQGCPGKIL